MSDRWAGFTDRLRRHGRGQDKTTRGYCDVAADRIDELEYALADSRRELKFAREVSLASAGKKP
jgi:hypothetical protein